MSLGIAAVGMAVTTVDTPPLSLFFHQMEGISVATQGGDKYKNLVCYVAKDANDVRGTCRPQLRAHRILWLAFVRKASSLLLLLPSSCRSSASYRTRSSHRSMFDYQQLTVG